MTRLPTTPPVILGPFYPVAKPAGAGASLLGASPEEYDAPLLQLAGRILTAQGKPVSGALVEVWQANEHGRYLHPGDAGGAPLTPDFLGYGMQHAGGDGGYRFETLLPAPYAVGGEMRPPHIHFQVTGAIDRLVTQMFFEDEPLNRQDRWFNAVTRPQQLLAKLELAAPSKPGKHAWRVQWDIVLANG